MSDDSMNTAQPDDAGGEGGEFGDSALPGEYDNALDTAAILYANLASGAQQDARIFAVGRGGAVQIIGTGRAWSDNGQVIVDGPCILVYAKDAMARAHEMRQPPVSG